MAHLTKTFRQIVSKLHAGVRGHRLNQVSNATYQIKGKCDVAFLEIALAVWDMRQARPELTQVEIGTILKVVPVRHRLSANDTPAEATAKKNIIGATVSRYLRKAKAIIENVGKGRFPDTGLSLPQNNSIVTPIKQKIDPKKPAGYAS